MSPLLVNAVVGVAGLAFALWLLLRQATLDLRDWRRRRQEDSLVRAAYLAAMSRARSYAARNACREAQELLDMALAGEPDTQELARRVGFLVVAAGGRVLADTLEYWVEDGADRLRWPDLKTDGHKVSPKDPLGRQP